MADKTHIEWTDATWNPITGCSVVSPGCTNCYAMKLAGTRLQHHPSRAGLTVNSKAGPVWNGKVRLNREWLAQPIEWKKPRMVFVCAHGDLFHEDVPDDWIDQVFAIMALAPHHTFQVLTKRADRMRDYLTANDARHRPRKDAVEVTGMNMVMEGLVQRSKLTSWPLPNVWLGVSVEDQARAEERIPALLDTPAAIRWVSAEPLLGPVRLDRISEFVDTFADCGGHPVPELSLDTQDATWLNPFKGKWEAEARGPDGSSRGPLDAGLLHNGGRLDWVVAGGESGKGARPMHPDWARALRDQCDAAGVPFFFKQWGNYAPLRGATPPDTMFHATKKIAGRVLDGIEHNAMPGAVCHG